MRDHKESNDGPVMLCLLPFWPPLTPPVGISALNGHIKALGSNVIIKDYNVNTRLWGMLYDYVNILRVSVPNELHSNIFDYAYHVIQNHTMAHIHRNDDTKYKRLVNIIVERTFGVQIPMSSVGDLINCVDIFLTELLRNVLLDVHKYSPSWFGVSTYSTTLGPTLAVLREVRKARPDIITIVGGGIFADHVAPGSSNFEAFRKVTEPYLDVVVTGEGELIFERLLRGDLPAKGVYHGGATPDSLLDLKSAATLDFGDLDMSLYSQMANYVGRSCPFQCSFCSETVQWGKYRAKSSSKFVRELADLNSTYGGKIFLLTDSLINPVADQVFGAASDASINLYFDTYLRADNEVCDPARVSKWKEGGFYRARLGIESGSPNILATMNKKTSPDVIRLAIKTLASHGIKTTTYWVIGHPGETEKDFNDSLALIDACADDIYEAEAHTFSYYPKGQVSSKLWARDYQLFDLFGEEYADLLVTRTWILNGTPTRAQTLDRMARFVSFCRERGIANPYNLQDIRQADERWVSGHGRAGPTLLDIHNVNYPALMG